LALKKLFETTMNEKTRRTPGLTFEKYELFRTERRKMLLLDWNMPSSR
jgi:hypothetical protein